MSRLIDADSLKERMFAETPEHEKGVVDIFLEAVAAMIDEQPTIEERKKGKWLELTNTNHTYVCSVCGRMLVNITDDKNMVTKNYPFCHCGADMRGEQNESD